MATIQSQITIPSNGAQVTVFSAEAFNSSQLSIRNTGTVTVLLGPPNTIWPPTNVVATSNATGGTFSLGTYYYKLTATNALGETTGSSEVVAAVGANGTVTLTWVAVSGATGYKIYRASAVGGETTSPALVTTIGSGATTTYTDTGAATTSGAVPTSNTAGVAVLFPLAINEFLGLSVARDDTLVAQVQSTGTVGQVTLLGVG